MWLISLFESQKDQLDNVRGNYYGNRQTSMGMVQFSAESAGKIL